ncbi:MAG: hypothetical protein LBU39_08050 [Desulfobulbaceae bacterium]|jgi:hypothetical protein|nr:hypothetical protein [Desulfobulbaceae bacterium]
MKITVDGSVVEVSPENAQEAADLDKLWKIVIDCYGNNKKIEPMGQYVPGQDKFARFHIVGMPASAAKTTYSEHKATKEGTYYCATCNKYVKVKAGDPIPLCCGREMELMD